MSKESLTVVSTVANLAMFFGVLFCRMARVRQAIKDESSVFVGTNQAILTAACCLFAIPNHGNPPWNRQSLLQTDQSIIKYLSLLLASAAAAAAAAAVLTTETVEARFPLCLPDAATTTATATAVTAMPRMWCQVKPFPIPFDLQRQDTPDNNTWTRI